MDRVLWFAEVWPNHPQPTKTAEVCLVQTKWTLISHCQLNLQILVWRKIFVFNLVVQVSILYKWPCSQCSVQQKWTLLAIHSYWCEETIVIMLVESKFSLNGSMEWWLHHPQPTKTTDVHTKTNAVCRLCSASVIYSADVIGEIAQKNSQPKYIWQLTNLNHFRCNFVVHLQIHRSTTPRACSIRFVLHLSFWTCGRCVLCVWPRITKYNFVWQVYLTFLHFNAIVPCRYKGTDSVSNMQNLSF